MFKSRSTAVAIMVCTTISTAILIGCSSTVDPADDTSAHEKDLGGPIVEPPTAPDPIFETDLGVGYLDIYSEELLPTADGYRYDLGVYFGIHSVLKQIPSRRTLSVHQKPAVDGYNGGYLSVLTDQDGNVLWEAEDALVATSPAHAIIRRTSPSGEIIFDRTTESSSFVETVTINGTAMTFEYPTNDFDYIHGLDSDLQSGLVAPISELPASPTLEEQVVYQLTRFHDFYDSNNTLDGSLEGQLVADFASCDAIGSWFASRHPADDPNEPYWVYDDCWLSAWYTMVQYCDESDPAYKEAGCHAAMFMLRYCLTLAFGTNYN